MLKRGGSRCYRVVRDIVESPEKRCVSFPGATPPRVGRLRAQLKRVGHPG